MYIYIYAYSIQPNYVYQTAATAGFLLKWSYSVVEGISPGDMALKPDIHTLPEILKTIPAENKHLWLAI